VPSAHASADSVLVGAVRAYRTGNGAPLGLRSDTLLGAAGRDGRSRGVHVAVYVSGCYLIRVQPAQTFDPCSYALQTIVSTVDNAA
jgi:hypothetical protein